MVKGTSRQVIVVHAPEEKLFEQAIFILKDGAVGEEGIPVPAAAELTGERSPELEKWLERELGIPVER